MELALNPAVQSLAKLVTSLEKDKPQVPRSRPGRLYTSPCTQQQAGIVAYSTVINFLAERRRSRDQPSPTDTLAPTAFKPNRGDAH